MLPHALASSFVRRDDQIGNWRATEVEEQEPSAGEPEAPPDGVPVDLPAERSVQLPVLIIASALVFGLGAFLLTWLIDGGGGGDGALADDQDGAIVEPGSSDAPSADEGSRGQVLGPATSSDSGSGARELDLSASSTTVATAATTNEAMSTDEAMTTDEAMSTDEAMTSEPTITASDPGETASVPTTETTTTTRVVATTTSVAETPTAPPTTAPTSTATRPTATVNTTATTEPPAAPVPAVVESPVTSTTVTITTTTATITTTTASPLPETLIVSPVEGSDTAWDALVQFVVNDVPAATTYCWTFLPDDHEVCGQSNTYTLPAQSRQVRPGPTTVVAEARDAAGQRLMVDNTRVDLIAPVRIVQPVARGRIVVNSRVQIAANPVPTADNYCWEFIQNEVAVASVCSPVSSFELAPGGSILGRLALVPVTIRHTVSRGSVVLGEDSISLSAVRRI